jgi:hypothetical protein
LQGAEKRAKQKKRQSCGKERTGFDSLNMDNNPIFCYLQHGCRAAIGLENSVDNSLRRQEKLAMLRGSIRLPICEKTKNVR